MTTSPMGSDVRLLIIGGGVVGNAAAYALARAGFRDVCLVERNPTIPGENQSSRNSGVVHAGVYYPKDRMPLKARLCVEGNRLLYSFCREHGVPCEQTGKLVVAACSREEAYLEDVLRIGRENRVPGIRRLSADEAQEMEPHVRAVSAVHVPSSGIVEPTLMVKKLSELARAGGVTLLPGHVVTGIDAEAGRFTVAVSTDREAYTITTRFLVNAAGLYSDVIARMVDPRAPYVMSPRRGESLKFNRTRRPGLGMSGLNVYPVPHGIDPAGRKLNVSFAEFERLFRENKIKKAVGVHLTPTFTSREGVYGIGDEVTVGPYVVGGVEREDYAASVEAEAFAERVGTFFPEVGAADLVFHQTGVTAQLKNTPDFVIAPDVHFPHCINLVGIESPGLTSSLAIARHVVGLLQEQDK